MAIYYIVSLTSFFFKISSATNELRPTSMRLFLLILYRFSFSRYPYQRYNQSWQCFNSTPTGRCPSNQHLHSRSIAPLGSPHFYLHARVMGSWRHLSPYELLDPGSFRYSLGAHRKDWYPPRGEHHSSRSPPWKYLGLRWSVLIHFSLHCRR